MAVWQIPQSSFRGRCRQTRIPTCRLIRAGTTASWVVQSFHSYSYLHLLRVRERPTYGRSAVFMFGNRYADNMVYGSDPGTLQRVLGMPYHALRLQANIPLVWSIKLFSNKAIAQLSSYLVARLEGNKLYCMRGWISRDGFPPRWGCRPFLLPLFDMMW